MRNTDQDELFCRDTYFVLLSWRKYAPPTYLYMFISIFLDQLSQYLDELD